MNHAERRPGKPGATVRAGGERARLPSGVLSLPRTQRTLIALVQVLGLTVWFSASAVVPTLQREWGISPATAVWLTASVQIGFVIGAIGSVVLALPDRCRPQLLMAAGASGAALCTAVLAFFVDGVVLAIILRFLTGVFLAAVYPVGMKVMASWSAPASRGRAFGVLIGALTLGSAMPHLISGIGDLPWRGVMGTAAAVAFAGALLSALLVRPGHFAGAAPEQPNPRYALSMFRERRPRLVNIGYFGHMWELYALWTWLPAFVLASQSARGAGTGGIGIDLFVAVGIGGVIGCLVGGWAADRWGRPVAAGAALAVSGACCLISPLMFTADRAPLAVFLFVWGAAVIADSGVFSASLSEAADKRHIGTALTAQTAFGFMLTVITIQFVPMLAGTVGWQFAFLLLLPGPVFGVVAMLRLSKNSSRPEQRTYDNDLNTNPFPAARRPDSGVVPDRY